ncbi:MAG: hypothetical protein EBR95_09715 [Verrucomicrobia bacterium]|nr:hypothetical protein [Verrucomicrobiota bacterium]
MVMAVMKRGSMTVLAPCARITFFGRFGMVLRSSIASPSTNQSSPESRAAPAARLAAYSEVLVATLPAAVQVPVRVMTLPPWAQFM